MTNDDEVCIPSLSGILLAVCIALNSNFAWETERNLKKQEEDIFLVKTQSVTLNSNFARETKRNLKTEKKKKGKDDSVLFLFTIIKCNLSHSLGLKPRRRHFSFMDNDMNNVMEFQAFLNLWYVGIIYNSFGFMTPNPGPPVPFGNSVSFNLYENTQKIISIFCVCN